MADSVEIVETEAENVVSGQVTTPESREGSDVSIKNEILVRHLSEYADESTLHGIRYIPKSRGLSRFVLKLLLFLEHLFRMDTNAQWSVSL